MVTVDLMALHEIGNPERLAQKIHEDNPALALPVPVDDVARAVGIAEIVADDSDSFEGVLVTNAEKSVGTIAYRASSAAERVRFTIGHEVGHFLIPTHTGKIQCTPGHMLAFEGRAKAKDRESEANRFAAELLMPRRRFGVELDAFGELDLRHAVALGSRYGVSLEAALLRIVELTAHECAIVFSRSGVVRYVRRTRGFPWLDVAKDGPLPRDCLSAKHKGALRAASDIDAVDIGEWADEPPTRFGSTLLEQTYPQGDGHRVTLLLLDDVDEDSEEE